MNQFSIEYQTKYYLDLNISHLSNSGVDGGIPASCCDNIFPNTWFEEHLPPEIQHGILRILKRSPEAPDQEIQ